MKTLLVAIAFLAAGPSASAADFPKCNESGTQSELNACAANDMYEADQNLNEVYTALLSQRSKDQLFVAKLRIAQQAWVTFRDAELEALFACADSNPRVCWGSMYPMSYAYAKAELTRARTRTLQALLQEALEQ